MIRRLHARRRRLAAVVAGLLITGAAGLCAGCDPLNTHAAAFGAGYLLGRWEATRVEIVNTQRICFQNGVQVACP